jgi:hypothetical protein
MTQLQTLYKAPGPLFCVDPPKRHPLRPKSLQKCHFRPSRPYPRVILGAGSESLRPMPPPLVRKIYPPTQGGRFTVSGPSATGPYTYFSDWDPWYGDENFGSGAFKGPLSGF